jgi:hypothetical protein
MTLDQGWARLRSRMRQMNPELHRPFSRARL